MFGSEDIHEHFPEQLEGRQPLQALNRVGWRNSARTDVPAISQGMAAKRARLACDQAESFGAGVVSRVDHEVQGPMQCHRPKVPGIQRHQRASGIARGAIYALGLAFQRPPLRAVMGDGINIILIQIWPRHKMGQGPLIRRKEGF